MNRHGCRDASNLDFFSFKSELARTHAGCERPRMFLNKTIAWRGRHTPSALQRDRPPTDAPAAARWSRVWATVDCIKPAFPYSAAGSCNAAVHPWPGVHAYRTRNSLWLPQTFRRHVNYVKL